MPLTDAELLELETLLRQKEIDLAQKGFIDFAKLNAPGFKFTDFHAVYYAILDLFAKGKIKKLIITVPPQHGKSFGSTKLLPAYILGTRPQSQIAITSYSATQARKFNRDIQRTIDSEVYREVFPKIKLAKSKYNEDKQSGEIQTADEFHISGFHGSLKSVGRGGALTGNPVDILILDDLYKDAAEANSPIIRDAVEQFYISVADTRLHNDSQQLIVFTRWHEDDLIGWIEKKQKVITIKQWSDLENIPDNAWVKLNFEAIKETEPTEIDPRIKGEALFPERHSIDKLKASRELDAENFNCLYQGNPMNSKGRLYQNPFKTYDELPELLQIKNYTDTADTGDDYLCSINYGLPLDQTDKHAYILDVIFTTEPMEVTEPLTASMLNKWHVSFADIESNSGGRSFARTMEQKTNTYINAFYQNQNKISRIFSNSNKVNDEIVFPANWAIRWPEFYNHVTRFKKKIEANKHDDGVDVLTGIVEKKNENFDDEIIYHND